MENNERKLCQSCAMPMESLDLHGTNADSSKNQDYCHYCYKDGAFTKNETMEEMIETCVPFVSKGNPWLDTRSGDSSMQIVIERKEQNKIPTLHIYNICCDKRKPIIFILHGYTGKKENLIEMAYGYARESYYVILFDALHHGELKDKEFEQMSQLEKDSTLVYIMIETAKFINALIDNNINNFRVDINRVALIGFSMGGNIIFEYISKMLSKRVKVAIPCISTPVWGKAVIRYTERTPGAERYFDVKRIREIMKIQPSNFTEGIKELPILIVIGEEDQIVPVDDIKTYYKNLLQNYNDTSKICLEIQKDVGHNITSDSFKKIELWIKKHL